MAAPKPTSAGRRDPELQLAWQRVDTRPDPCLDLELVCGGTRSSGYRQLSTSFIQNIVQICKLISQDLIFLSGKTNHIKIYDFLKNNKLND
jgi:hypothetical protein